MLHHKNIIHSFLVAACTVLLSQPTVAQVNLRSSLSAVEIFIGQQADLEVEITCDAASTTQFPFLQVGDTLVEGVEIVEVAAADTQYLNENIRKSIRQKYTITSFDTAFYYLPPMEVLVDSQSYMTESLALQVYTFEVDTVNVEQFFGPHDIAGVPYSWCDDFALPFYLSLFLFPLFGLFIYLYVQYKDNKPIIRRVKVEPPVPAHLEAAVSLEAIRSEKREWQDEDPKLFYVRLTDVVRHYMTRRFGFHAMEMTSDEIMEALYHAGMSEDTDAIKELFQVADLVKFAKHQPLINEKNAHITVAGDFVEKTRQEDELTAQVKEEIVVEYKRSRKSILAIRISLFVLPLLMIVLLYFIINGLYDVIV